MVEVATYKLVKHSSNKKGSQTLVILEERCKGCNFCIEFCPTDVFETSGKLNRKGYYLPVVARVEDCTGCKLCDLLCPEFAIVILYVKVPSKAK